MITIWKFELEVNDDIEIEMPYFAKILHVDIQYQHILGKLKEIPCIWALVDTENLIVKRRFLLCSTGNPMPDIPLGYIGTFNMEKDLLIFLFEKLEQLNECMTDGEV